MSNSNQDSQVSQVGGLTRVSHGQPEAGTIQAPEIYTQQRVGGTVHRFQNGLQVDALDVSRHQEGAPPQHNGSVMATLLQQGPHRTVELIPGMASSRTNLQTAIRDGLVREVSQGVYVDAHATQPQPMPSQQQSQGALEGDIAQPFSFVDANDMALWNEDVAPIAQHSYDSAVASVVAMVGSGTGSLESIAARLAASEGIEPALAQQYVTEGVNLYKESLSRDLVKSVGLPRGHVEAFYDWSRTQPQLQKALSQLMHEGKTEEFRSMALAYKRQASGRADTAAFKAAGMETMVDRATGELMVRIGQGRWINAREL